jgi:hypothetical protein
MALMLNEMLRRIDHFGCLGGGKPFLKFDTDEAKTEWLTLILNHFLALN